MEPTIGLEEVGAHAGDVAHVVAHVVGDGGGVAGVVLGDAGLDLAHQVGAHVGGLGVDAAAHAGEQRDGGGAHGEAGDDRDDHLLLGHQNVARRRRRSWRGTWAEDDVEQCRGPRAARPTTLMPITAPPEKATIRAGLRPLRAALVVRTLAAVATRMPKKPASPEQTAPTTKDDGDQPVAVWPGRCWPRPGRRPRRRRRSPGPCTRGRGRPSRRRGCGLAISFILSVPASCLLIQEDLINAKSKARAPAAGIP